MKDFDLQTYLRRLDNLVGDLGNIVNGHNDVPDDVKTVLDEVSQKVTDAYYTLKALD